MIIKKEKRINEPYRLENKRNKSIYATHRRTINMKPVIKKTVADLFLI